MTTLNRRKFLKLSTAAVSSFMIVPRHVLGKGFTPPSDKLNIAAIGIGGQGAWHLENLESENMLL